MIASTEANIWGRSVDVRPIAAHTAVQVTQVLGTRAGSRDLHFMLTHEPPETKLRLRRVLQENVLIEKVRR